MYKRKYLLNVNNTKFYESKGNSATRNNDSKLNNSCNFSYLEVYSKTIVPKNKPAVELKNNSLIITPIKKQSIQRIICKSKITDQMTQKTGKNLLANSVTLPQTVYIKNKPSEIKTKLSEKKIINETSPRLILNRRFNNVQKTFISGFSNRKKNQSVNTRYMKEDNINDDIKINKEKIKDNEEDGNSKTKNANPLLNSVNCSRSLKNYDFTQRNRIIYTKRPQALANRLIGTNDSLLIKKSNDKAINKNQELADVKPKEPLIKNTNLNKENDYDAWFKKHSNNKKTFMTETQEQKTEPIAKQKGNIIENDNSYDAWFKKNCDDNNKPDMNKYNELINNTYEKWFERNSVKSIVPKMPENETISYINKNTDNINNNQELNNHDESVKNTYDEWFGRNSEKMAKFDKELPSENKPEEYKEIFTRTSENQVYQIKVVKKLVKVKKKKERNSSSENNNEEEDNDNEIKNEENKYDTDEIKDEKIDVKENKFDIDESIEINQKKEDNINTTKNEQMNMDSQFNYNNALDEVKREISTNKKKRKKRKTKK